MGKNPNYNPTVPTDSDDEVPIGALLEAAVGRENVVAVTGTPTTDDAFPRDGRVAVDTSTDPDTYYIGDGSSWNAVASTTQFQGLLNVRSLNVETLSGDKTLATGDPQLQVIDPGGAARNVDLPAEEAGLQFLIGNAADAAEDITVRDDADSTVLTLNQDDVGLFIAYDDGTNSGWVAFETAGFVS